MTFSVTKTNRKTICQECLRIMKKNTTALGINTTKNDFDYLCMNCVTTFKTLMENKENHKNA